MKVSNTTNTDVFIDFSIAVYPEPFVFAQDRLKSKGYGEIKKRSVVVVFEGVGICNTNLIIKPVRNKLNCEAHHEYLLKKLK